MTSTNPHNESDLSGRILEERFEIVQQIGSGGMGSVYLGRQLSMDREIAIKVLRPGLPESATQRFLREAKTLSGLSHPGIVQIIDHGQTDDGIIFIAMEMVEGLSLQELVELGRLHPQLAMEIVDQVASALTEAHRHGVIHRDLKPANIVVKATADGELLVKLLDFGIAYSESDPRLTQSGSLCGTPAYMAPEQAQGRDVSPETDFYALGITLYQMLSGRLPFYSESPLGVLLKHLKDKPPPLQPHVEYGLLPDELVRLCKRLLKKEKANRPTSSREIRDAVVQMRPSIETAPLRLSGMTEQDYQAWVLPPLTDSPHADAAVSNVFFDSSEDDNRRGLGPLDARPTERMEPVTGTEETMTGLPPVRRSLSPDDAPENVVSSSGRPSLRAGIADETQDPNDSGARAWAAFAEAADSAPDRDMRERLDPNLWDVDSDAASFSGNSLEFQIPANFFAIEPHDTGARDAPAAAGVSAGMIPAGRRESMSSKDDDNLKAEAPVATYELAQIDPPRPKSPEQLRGPQRAPELARQNTFSSQLASNLIYVVLIVGIVASMAFIGMKLFVDKPPPVRRDRPIEQRGERVRDRPADEASSEEEAAPSGESSKGEVDQPAARKEAAGARKKRSQPSSRDEIEELKWSEPVELYGNGKLEKKLRDSAKSISTD